MGRDSSELLLMADFTAATSEADLLQRAQPIGQALGMNHVLFGVQVARRNTEPLVHVVSGYPAAYDQMYRDRGFVRLDPTVPHCMTRDDAMVWDPADYKTPESHEVLDEARRFGLGYGLSIAVRRGTHAQLMFSMARDRPFESQREIDHAIAGAKVLATIGLHVIENIVVPQLELAHRPHLTPRELECLKWLAQGKSNSVIGDILNLSEDTVEFHVKNLYKKLDVTTRLQAAIKALELKLVT